MEKALENLSKYRTFLMGFAILWILLYHSGTAHIPTWFDNLSGIWNWIIRIIKLPLISKGWGGVDIFLFVSGFGCWHALSKNSDVLNFYKRRLIRFLPYIPLCIIFLLFISQEHYNLPEILGLFLLENFWLGWKLHLFDYLSYLGFFYLLTPSFYNIIKNHCNKMTAFVKLLLVCFIIILPIMLLPNFSEPDFRMLGSVRLLIFVAGLYAGHLKVDLIKTHPKTLKNIYMLGILAFIIVCINHFTAAQFHYFGKNIDRVLFLFIAPVLCFALANFIDKFQNNKLIFYIKCFYEFLGKHSLEIYLIDQLVLNFFVDYVNFFTHLLCSLGLGILYAFCYKLISNQVAFYYQKLKLFVIK